jgi:hypothetical protein
VDDRKFETLGAVDCHEAHGIKALGRGGKLSKIALVLQAQQSPNSAEQPRDLLAWTGRLDTKEVHELPKGDGGASVLDRIRLAVSPGYIGAVEKNGAKDVPRV